MGIFDSSINRTYKCDNQECGAIIACLEKVSDSWQEYCPFCDKKSLYLENASVNISIFMEPSVPKTFGSQAEKNTDQRTKEGIAPKNSKKPWWRKNKNRVDFRVLKNPKQYIQTGQL
jgi:hypothetical protein